MSVLLGAPPTDERQQIQQTRADGPRRPSVSLEPLDTFDASPRRAAEDRGNELEESFDTWLTAARDVARRAEISARDNEASPSAQARYAQAAWAAGLTEEAMSAARQALKLVSSATSNEIASAYVALSILVATGMASAAENLYRDLPRDPSLDLLIASALLDAQADDQAEKLISDSPLGLAACLRGYIRLRRSDFGGAVTSLRQAMNLNPNDAEAPYLLSFAYAGLGSPRKALRYARQAARLAPGRRDIGIGLLDRLVAQGEFASALQEIKKVKNRNIVETPDFMIAQGRVDIGLGKQKQALSLLRRARDASTKDQVLAAELDSNIAVLRESLGEILSGTVLTTHRRSLEVAPGSIPIASMLMDRLTLTTDADEAISVLAGLREAGHPEIGLSSIAARVAFLAGDYEECVKQSRIWHRLEPRNPWPVTLAAMITGQLFEDWAGASAWALGVWKTTHDAWLANDAAYILALAGKPGTALDILSRTDRDDFVLRATRGLALMADGQFKQGLKAYRDAADLADESHMSDHGRALMTVHQAMALKRLGLDAETVPELRAGALPPVELPPDWPDSPAFCLLREAARRRGWDWPVLVL